MVGLTKRLLAYNLLYGSLLGNIPGVWTLNHVTYDHLLVFVWPHCLIVWHSDVSDYSKYSLTLLVDEDDRSPVDEAIGMVVPDGFQLHSLDQLLFVDKFWMKRCVFVKLIMAWFGDLITRKSQERTIERYVYRVDTEEDSVRSIKLTFAAYSRGTGAAVGAFV